MQIAIDEMLQSRSEHRHKPDPLVGAVLVGPTGREIDRAHRGHFSAGDHAEFTLLEKLTRGMDPAACTLYVTLEPCTRRRPPKEPCARRIVKKRLGRVVIGMPDPNPDIHYRGIGYLIRNEVRVEFFDKDLSEQIREANKAFLLAYYEKTLRPRSGTSGPSYEASPHGRPEAETFSASFEELRPANGARIEDFDLAAINEFMEARGELSRFRIPSPGLWGFFKKAGFLAERPGRPAPVPTFAGLVLFGRKPSDYLPQCKIKAVCLIGGPQAGNLPENVAPNGRVDIVGPLPRMVEQARGFFLKHVAQVPVIEDFRTVQAPEYPERVVREAIINALVHRDYNAGRHAIFEMLRDRIVVKSPGYPPLPLTLERIRSYRVESLQRNPHLANAAHQMGYGDEWASGIPSMPVRLKEHGLREPEFAYDLGFFVVTFFGREHSGAHIRIGRETLARLSPRQQQLLRLIHSRGSVASETATRRFQITRETANQDFRKLTDLGLITREGTGRSTRYVPRFSAPDANLAKT